MKQVAIACACNAWSMFFVSTCANFTPNYGLAVLCGFEMNVYHYCDWQPQGQQSMVSTFCELQSASFRQLLLANAAALL